MFVIGTAGHVDHGKSTLVKALTGIDPDRLQEEKDREMTIDLGFAWLTLPSGRDVSIVDVPGHERFVRNMLAGVGGIDLALLVVAADEAVMPQTREHLAILDILQVKRGIAVITKRDLVDQDWLDLVTAEVEETLKGTVLEGSPVRAVSSYTGQGLPELVATIDEMLNVAQPRPDKGRPRLPVDRSFVISGFGTVVTGTLTDGTLTVGQEVELVLAQKRARIRGLQTHRKGVETALPGTRTAVNLAGISHEEVQRGDVLTTPGWLQPTIAMDVRLRLVRDAIRPLKHDTVVTFHSGTSETMCRVRLLDRAQLAPGEEGWAQLRLENPVAVVKDDYFVIRSADATLGGGTVADPHAKRHRRLNEATLQHLDRLQAGTAADVLLEALEAHGPSGLQALAQQANLSLEETRHHVQALVEEARVIALGNGPAEEGAILLSTSLWKDVVARASQALASYHRQSPLRRGASREDIRTRLGLEPQVSLLALQRLIRDKVIVEEDALLRLPQHRVAITQAQRQRMDGYLRLLESQPYSPSLSEPPEPDLVQLLVEEGKAVKVSDDVVFTATAYQQMVDRIVQHLKSEGKITVAQVRDMFNTSRKYALALMEHLDQQRVTRRVGDERVLR